MSILQTKKKEITAMPDKPVKLPIDTKLESMLDISLSSIDRAIARYPDRRTDRDQRHDCYIECISDYEWLLGKFVQSKQFTPEQQTQMQKLIERWHEVCFGSKLKGQTESC
jgi:hypothetical protein